jgi:glutaminase
MMTDKHSVIRMALFAGLVIGSLFTQAQAVDINAVVNAAYEKYKDLEEGANADYIPALAKVDPNMMARVMEDSGTQVITDNMGVDATGQVFNSIVAIEQYQGQQMNPMVNPGAIATTSMVKGGSEKKVWKNISDTYDDFAGRKLTVMEDIYKSEADTNQRNQALAMLMYAYGRIEKAPIEATDIYTRQCSVGVNARDLATMAATLANGGKNPVTGKTVVSQEIIPEVLAVMATAGLYDDTGQWLYKTGLPAKSGVGGGILAVSPGKFGIAAISPPLDPAGNSIRAQRAIADISNALGGNPYNPVPK